MHRFNLLSSKNRKRVLLLFEAFNRRLKDIVCSFRELSNETLMSKTDITLEEALKAQQGVLCMRNSNRGLVKTASFGILVKCNRKAFNLDFVSVDNKPIKYWVLNTKKASEILENETFIKDSSVNGHKKKNKKRQQNIESFSLSNPNTCRLNRSDLTKLLKHPSAPVFIRKRGDISAIVAPNHPRITFGKFSCTDSCGQIVIKPFDSKLPKICVPKRSLVASNGNLAHTVTIDEWLENNDFAYGKILETFEISNLDYDFVVTKGLILNEIDTRNYSEEFEDSVLKKSKIDESFFDERLDLRREIIFTIDSKEAEDLDDALSCKLLKNGCYEMGIHISDVSHFVKPRTYIDEMARKRNSSVYLPLKYIPMLPRTLRKDFCSLLPGEDRLTISLIFHVTEEGIVFKEFYKLSVINSSKKFCYEEAEKVITANVNETPEHESILLLHKLSTSLRNQRLQSNALHFQRHYSKFRVEKKNEDLEVKQINEPRMKSEMLVEELMILANSKVASYLLQKYPNCTLLRSQPPIPDKLLHNLQSLCKGTIHLKANNMKQLQNSISEIVDDGELHQKEIIANTLIYLIQKSNRRAKYVSSGIHKNVPMFHSTLNTTYTHFTSPIRRYADIVVHRLLKSGLQEKPTDYEITDNNLAMIAELCNSRKIAIKKVTKICHEFLMKSYIEKNGPFTESCAIIAVHKNHFSVFVNRFSFVAKLNYSEIDGIKSFKVLTKDKKPGVYTVVLKFSDDKNIKLKPLTVIPISLNCISNEEKHCFELMANINFEK